MTEKEYLYWLCHVPGLRAEKMERLLNETGGFRSIYYMKEQELKACHFLTARERGAILSEKRNLESCTEEYHRLRERGIDFITIYDSGYPERLRELPGMPLGLFVKGRLPEDQRPSAAVIGARGCSYYGREEARYLSRELARAGVQVVSGLALGIDGAGHGGALEAGGEVVLGKVRENLSAVIGSGTKYDSRSTGELEQSLGLSPAKMDRNGNQHLRLHPRQSRSQTLCHRLGIKIQILPAAAVLDPCHGTAGRFVVIEKGRSPFKGPWMAGTVLAVFPVFCRNLLAAL